MRTLITLLAITVGLLVAAAVFWASRPSTGPAQPPAATQQQTPPSPTTQQATPAAAPQTADTAGPSTAPATAPEPELAIEPIQGLRALPAPEAQAVSLGSIDPVMGYKMRVDLSPYGGGVWRIDLADYAQMAGQDDRYTVLGMLTAPNPQGGDPLRIYPFAAKAVTINGQRLNLETLTWTADPVERSERETSATYRLRIVDGQDQPVLEIVRRYVLPVDSYDLRIEQQLINLSGQALEVRWEQNIQGDLPTEKARYTGDVRKFVTGYFAPWDPRRINIYTNDGFVPRANVIKSVQEDAQQEGVWPNPSIEPGSELVWVAAENRYFSVVTHPVVPAQASRPADVPALEAAFSDLGATVLPPGGEWKPEQRAVMLTLVSQEQTLAPGQRAELDLAVFAGPRQSEVLAQPPYTLLGLGEMVRYELGCTWCTFQWLAKGLLAFLEGIHWVVRDWGVAIIVLVLVVRLLLHPLTRRAQINMMKLGKQMQTLQPEMERLRKKYKDDQARLNQEMIKLYREKGVNPASAIGCLPMFLQTPIWIALYAMLYFAIELRHQPAFYGIFQWISGGRWHFLQDLSSPDNFIRFVPLGAEGVAIPLPFINLHLTGINLLPILMAVVFYFQQRLTTPPPQNEQQVAQQRMMKFMVLLFPLFLYSAPSGLTLYILVSTFAGIVDSYIVRKHIREQEKAGTLFEKKPRKPGGLMDRLTKAMEERQKQMMARQQGAMQRGRRKR